MFDRKANAVAPDPILYYQLVFGIDRIVLYGLQRDAATYFEPRPSVEHGLVGSTPHNAPTRHQLDLLREVVMTWTKTCPDASGRCNYLKFIDKSTCTRICTRTCASRFQGRYFCFLCFFEGFIAVQWADVPTHLHTTMCPQASTTLSIYGASLSSLGGRHQWKEPLHCRLWKWRQRLLDPRLACRL
jgi:hypothetical protein